MSNFSINPHTKEDIVDQYTDFLSNELNYDIWHVDENDVYNPLLLQQMGVLRASRIQKAVETNGEILYQGFNYTNQTIRTSSRELAKKMGQVAAGITSSLDRGFTAMHHSLSCINEGISVTNTHLGNINSSLDTLNKNVGETNQQLKNIDNTIRALGNMVGQGFSILHERLNAANTLLQSVLDELRIPETQRERRFHIEEGAKYLAMAMKENDQLYYEDAIAEFEAALKIERKDFYSWFSLGFIYLRSIYHINIEKSIDSFSRFVHYARAEAMQRNNQSLKYKIDEAYLLMAEANYLLKNPYEAIQLTEKCENNKEKSLFMKVKYLSFMGDEGSKKRATDILRDLVLQNPFLSLQVLEDADIINNEYIVSMLDQLRIDTVKEAIKQYNKLLQNVKDKGATYDGLQDIVDLINKHTYLDAVEAFYKMKNFIFYINLGLPSGTLWSTSNVGGDYASYTYDEAVSKFGNKLPSEEQLEELKNQCTWTWTGSGYKVVGPNGNSICLPAVVYRDSDGNVSRGSYGSYWSSTPRGSDSACFLDFNPDRVGMYLVDRCSYYFVRLVQDKKIAEHVSATLNL